MDKFVRQALRVRRIATKRAKLEITRRCASKASAYLRGLEIVNAFGIAGDKTPHEMALAVADSHTFTRNGSDRTWSGQVKAGDFKDKKRQTASNAVNKANAAADKNIKSERIAARKASATPVAMRPKRTKAPRIQVYHG